jgi:hypothetical protein
VSRLKFLALNKDLHLKGRLERRKPPHTNRFHAWGEPRDKAEHRQASGSSRKDNGEKDQNSGEVNCVETNSRQLEDETTAYRVDALSEPAVSPEKVVSSLRELREALTRVSDLATEEDLTVEAFLETRRSISVTISRVPLEPSLLPKRLGPVEAARMNDEGALVLTTPDGGIETIDLTNFDNRDLLTTVLGDLLEKLRGLADGTPGFPEIRIDEPIIGGVIVEAFDILEPPMIEEVVDPEAMEEALSTSEEIDIPTEEPPVSIEPELVDLPVEKTLSAQHDPVEYKPYKVPQIIKEPIFTPTILSDSVLGRFRAQVQWQRRADSRLISEVRWLREAQVHRMRSGAEVHWIQEETGLLVSLKKLLSRRSGKQ